MYGAGTEQLYGKYAIELNKLETTQSETERTFSAEDAEAYEWYLKYNRNKWTATNPKRKAASLGQESQSSS